MEHLNFEAELNAPKTEASPEQLATWIREARANDGVVKGRDLYEGDLMRRLCALAGMSGNYNSCRTGAECKQVTDAAAKALGVTI